METLDEIEKIFTEGVREAGERTRTAGVETVTRMNEEKMQDSDKTYSFEPADFEKPITLQDIEVLRSIGRKSINAFTSEDIEKAQKWAYKFYKEMGTKSPFFRAWFGDWRVYDRSNFVEILEMEQREGKNPRGEYKNRDTGWVINSSSVGYDETVSHSGKDKKSLIAMRNIDKIIENAILLDTEVSEYGRGKKSVYTAFMHKLYAPIRIDGKMYLAKLSVEESNAPGQSQIDKKFYHVRAIKIETASSVGIGESHTPIIEDTASDISIADLFAFVKQYDKEFSPKPVNELMLDENKEPRVFYHGTRSQFTEFILQDKPKFGRALGDGFYFTPSYSKAHQFANGLFSKGQDRGGIIMPVYLHMENPYVIKENADRTKWHNEYYKGDYDGIIDLKNQTWYVEGSTQIKSAADNIGTFDSTNTDIRYSTEATTDWTPSKSPDVSENRDLTDRELLGMALEGAVQNEAEYTIVKEYREQASMLELVKEKRNGYSKEAAALERQIKALRARMEDEGDPNGYIRKAMDEAIAKKRQAEAMRDEQDRVTLFVPFENKMHKRSR